MFFSDQPWQPGTESPDLLGSEPRLEALKEHLTSEDIETPLNVAICGSWGSGKTSSMRWLENKLRKEHAVLWFNPWKYSTKEEVLRGLISEVIYKCLSVDNTVDAKRLRRAVQQFGAFLGGAFLSSLEALTLQLNPAGKGKILKGIREQYLRHIQPQKLYLNSFESEFKKWVGDTLQNGRMTVFVDDLDRCLPDVAIEVLEAIKLYANIEGLVFVVGVDRNVINRLVVHHYRLHGLEEKFSRGYISKIFQIEVVIEPSEHSAICFAKALMNDVLHSLDPRVLDKYILPALISVGGRSPREIKRLLNGLFAVVKRAENWSVGLNDGIQAFLIREFLFRNYPDSVEFESDLMQEFLQSSSLFLHRQDRVFFFSQLFSRSVLNAEPEGLFSSWIELAKRSPLVDAATFTFVSSWAKVNDGFLKLCLDSSFCKLLYRLYTPIRELKRLEFHDQPNKKPARMSPEERLNARFKAKQSFKADARKAFLFPDPPPNGLASIRQALWPYSKMFRKEMLLDSVLANTNGSVGEVVHPLTIYWHIWKEGWKSPVSFIVEIEELHEQGFIELNNNLVSLTKTGLEFVKSRPLNWRTDPGRICISKSDSPDVSLDVKSDNVRIIIEEIRSSHRPTDRRDYLRRYDGPKDFFYLL